MILIKCKCCNSLIEISQPYKQVMRESEESIRKYFCEFKKLTPLPIKRKKDKFDLVIEALRTQKFHIPDYII